MGEYAGPPAAVPHRPVPARDRDRGARRRPARRSPGGRASSLIEWPDRLGRGAARRTGSTCGSTAAPTAGRRAASLRLIAHGASHRRYLAAALAAGAHAALVNTPSTAGTAGCSRSTRRRPRSSSRPARPTGDVLAAEAFEGRYRHSQELLPAVVRVIERAGLRVADLAGVVVGTGPGAFTGLRVGIATAKTLAHELGCPIVGDPVVDAPCWRRWPARRCSGCPPARVIGSRSSPARSRSWWPVADAGPDGRRPARSRSPSTSTGDRPRRHSRSAARPSRACRRRCSGSVRRGSPRASATIAERLVPRYASPPRGAPASDSEGGVAWSRDPR